MATPFKFKVWLCNLILGRCGVEHAAQCAYEAIWPKHEAYREETMRVLRVLALWRVENDGGGK